MFSKKAVIAAFAAAVPLTQVDPQLVTSKALTLYEGTIASGGNRYEASVIANSPPFIPRKI